MPKHKNLRRVCLPTSWGRLGTGGGAHTTNTMDEFWMALILALYAAMLGLVWLCDRLLSRN